MPVGVDGTEVLLLPGAGRFMLRRIGWMCRTIGKTGGVLSPGGGATMPSGVELRPGACWGKVCS